MNKEQIKELIKNFKTNEEILNEYKTTNNINIDKMKLASQILESYYGEYCGIKYFFNI